MEKHTNTSLAYSFVIDFQISSADIYAVGLPIASDSIRLLGFQPFTATFVLLLLLLLTIMSRQVQWCWLIWMIKVHHCYGSDTLCFNPSTNSFIWTFWTRLQMLMNVALQMNVAITKYASTVLEDIHVLVPVDSGQLGPTRLVSVSLFSMNFLVWPREIFDREK